MILILFLCEHSVSLQEAAGTGTEPSEEVDNDEASEEVDIDELDPPKVLGDVLESVAGAVFLDSGLSLDSVWSVFCPLFEERIGESCKPARL